jgi:rhamnose utilization protein RhaD (predicted bifunctional aldolase and dehydrogenase)
MTEMTETADQILQRAIQTLSRTDPLVKLVPQVRLGKMQPSDRGLQAVTESWLATYRQVLESSRALDRASLRRLDPAPRVAVLVEAGVIGSDHPAAAALAETFAALLKEAPTP